MLLASCASQPPDERPITIQTAERLEASLSAERVRLAPEQAATDLERALLLYSLADDQGGQVRCHLRLTRLYYILGEWTLAQNHLKQGAEAAARLGDARALYESALLQGRLNGRKQDYETALSHALRPIEKAVALTYLGRTEEAYALIRGRLDQADADPDDYAFVLQAHARAVGDLRLAQRALDLFKQADNAPGIAGTLELMGHIATGAGRHDLARGFYERALVVNRARGDQDAVNRIERELAEI